MSAVSCFCGRREMSVEHARYAIDGVPCCDTLCYDAALEAQGVRHGNVVMVTVRRPEARQFELPLPFEMESPLYEPLGIYGSMG